MGCGASSQAATHAVAQLPPEEKAPQAKVTEPEPEEVIVEKPSKQTAAEQVSTEKKIDAPVPAAASDNPKASPPPAPEPEKDPEPAPAGPPTPSVAAAAKAEPAVEPSPPSDSVVKRAPGLKITNSEMLRKDAEMLAQTSNGVEPDLVDMDHIPLPPNNTIQPHMWAGSDSQEDLKKLGEVVKAPSDLESARVIAAASQDSINGLKPFTFKYSLPPRPPSTEPVASVDSKKGSMVNLQAAASGAAAS